MSEFRFETLRKSASLVIDPQIDRSQYLPLDLSVKNPDIAKVDASSSQEWEQYIDAILRKHHKKVAYGGYLEKRNLYQRSKYFKNTENNRNIHLGIDFWIAAGTSVHALLEGTVHSFQDNQNYGDYGPTIILEHRVQNQIFHSLYGHLSRESLQHITVGQTVLAGEKIAELGDASVNGDYAPHLHFQLVIDMEGKTGDYPGVCAESDQKKYADNCPNPLKLLNLD